MNKKLMIRATAAIIIFSAFWGVCFGLYTTVVINLNWGWNTNGFSVYTDAQHQFKFNDQDHLDLGIFTILNNTGSKTFYIVNEGNTQVSVFPHFQGTNMTGSFNYGEMPLGPGSELDRTFSFTITGPGTAQVWFNTTP